MSDPEFEALAAATPGRFCARFTCSVCDGSTFNDRCEYCVGGLSETEVDTAEECSRLLARGEISEQFFDAAMTFFLLSEASEVKDKITKEVQGVAGLYFALAFIRACRYLHFATKVSAHIYDRDQHIDACHRRFFSEFLSSLQFPVMRIDGRPAHSWSDHRFLTKEKE